MEVGAAIGEGYELGECVWASGAGDKCCVSDLGADFGLDLGRWWLGTKVDYGGAEKGRCRCACVDREG